ncbi:MAG: ATPase [Bacteroidia bacterium]|nr:MAG: ATPase [Bacteroidia bacterium]
MQNILLHKLDAFIKKYYYNQLIKGSIFFSISALSIYLFITFTEFIGNFNSTIRFILLMIWLSSNLAALIYFICLPVLKLLKIGKTITYKEAAIIIGKHFPNIQDKLLNALLLEEMAQQHPDNPILFAAIEQKSNELKPIPFTSIISYKNTLQYLKWIIPPAFVTLLIFIFIPDLFKSSTKRIIKYNQSFYTPPFTFEIENSKLECLQNDNFDLNVKVKGKIIPDKIYIQLNGNNYIMQKINKDKFSFTIKSPQKNIDFSLKAMDVEEHYTLKVIPKPTISAFQIHLQYPAYLNKKIETLRHTGDLIIPEGTKVSWNFTTQNTSHLYLIFKDTTIQISSKNNSTHFQKTFKESTPYIIAAKNEYLKNPTDSTFFSIQIIPDQYPTIEIQQFKDSSSIQFNPSFYGIIKDDYGFTKLEFVAIVYTKDSSDKDLQIPIKSKIPIAQTTTQSFQYFLDHTQFPDLKPGDKMEYYFEVFDNDGVNGPKKTRSEIFTFAMPLLSEIDKTINQNSDQIKEQLESNIKRTKTLQKDLNDLYRKILEKKQISFEDKKTLQNLLQKHKAIQENIEALKQKLNQNKELENQKELNEELMKKYEELQKLFDNIMTPELQKLMKELEELMNKFLDKNQLQQKIEELKLNTKEIEKELDRTLEIFKQFQVEQKLEQAIQQLDKLHQEQEKLAQQSEDKKSNPQELLQKQEELNQQFKDIQENLKELQNINQSLERPNKLPNTQPQEQQIENEQQQATQQLQNNNKNNSSKHQKKAAQKMQELEQQLQQALEQMQKEQQAESEENIKQILDNLLHISFEQENLMKQLQTTKPNDPKYAQIARQQKKLYDQTKIVEDSILALSKRNPQLSSTINKEISNIQQNMNQTIQQLAEHNSSIASMHMQKTFTSVNNLALMLNESLEQLQQQMKNPSSRPGSGSCKKPGSGKGQKPSTQPSKPKLSELQKQLNEQLKQLKEGMQKGQKNNKGQFPGGSMAEQLAKMAAQQEMIRQQLQELMQKLKQQGKNPGGDIASMMEETEKDIVNNRITEQTIWRQQEILTRLLESEKAIREQEEDEKRESREPKNYPLSNQNKNFEYNKQHQKQIEELLNSPLYLKPFYREKTQQYFNNLK